MSVAASAAAWELDTVAITLLSSDFILPQPKQHELHSSKLADSKINHIPVRREVCEKCPVLKARPGKEKSPSMLLFNLHEGQ